MVDFDLKWGSSRMSSKLLHDIGRKADSAQKPENINSSGDASTDAEQQADSKAQTFTQRFADYSYRRREKWILSILAAFLIALLLSLSKSYFSYFSEQYESIIPTIFFFVVLSFFSLVLFVCLVLLLYRWFKDIRVKILGFIFVFLYAISVNCYYFYTSDLTLKDTGKASFITALLVSINNSSSIFFPSRGEYYTPDIFEDKEAGFMIN